MSGLSKAEMAAYKANRAHSIRLAQGVGLFLLSLVASIYFFLFFTFFIHDYGSGFAYLGSAASGYVCFLLGLPTLLFFSYFAYVKPRCKGFYFAFGLTMAILGFATVLLIAIFSLNGTLHSLLDGRYTAIYPLDALLLGFLYCGLSPYLMLKSRKSEVKFRFVGVRVLLYGLFRGFVCLIALYFLGDLLLSSLSFEASSSYAFDVLPIYLLSALLVVYMYLTPLPYKKRLLAYAVLLGLAAFFSLWFIISYSANPYLLNLSMVAFFPIDFMGSILLGPSLLLAFSLLATSLDLGASIYRKKKEDGHGKKDE